MLFSLTASSQPNTIFIGSYSMARSNSTLPFLGPIAYVVVKRRKFAPSCILDRRRASRALPGRAPMGQDDGLEGGKAVVLGLPPQAPIGSLHQPSEGQKCNTPFLLRFASCECRSRWPAAIDATPCTPSISQSLKPKEGEKC